MLFHFSTLKGTESVQVKINNSNGFTLIELLIALAIFLIVIGAAYSTFLSQQKSYIVQEQVAGIQQNIRAAMFIMQRELRNAGYDANRSDDVNTGIIALGNGDGFNNDSNNNSTTDEAGEASMGITFSYIADDDGRDNDGDGITDKGVDPGDWRDDDWDEMVKVRYSFFTDTNGDTGLARQEVDTGPLHDPLTTITDPDNSDAIVENIDALDLVFKDQNGAVINSPSNNIANIRSVEITIVARADRADLDYTNSTAYLNNQNTTIYTAPGDNFRRRKLTTEVKLRNLSLP